MRNFLQIGATVMGTYYANLSTKLREAIRRGMLSKGVLLLQDNSLVYNSHVAQMEASSCGCEILFRTLYLFLKIG